jgi:hypothetical protein
MRRQFRRYRLPAHGETGHQGELTRFQLRRLDIRSCQTALGYPSFQFVRADRRGIYPSLQVGQPCSSPHVRLHDYL